MKNLLQLYLEKAALVWGIVGFVSLIVLGIVFPSLQRSLWLLAFLLALILIATYKPWVLYQWRGFMKRFNGEDTKSYTPEEFLKHIREKEFDGQFLLGTGFEWKREHLQETYEIKTQKEKGLQFLLNGDKNSDKQGAQWIHALDKEKEITIPEGEMFQHSLITGSSGSGKTSALSGIIEQAIAKGWNVLVLDPKGDKNLFSVTKKSCELCGRDFKFFLAAHPEKSTAIDLLANYGRVTELASRVAQLLPGEDGNDPFKEMCCSALRTILGGMAILGEKPTIKSIYANLTEHVSFANRVIAHWLVQEGKIEKENLPKGRTTIETFASLSELCELYPDKPSEISAVINLGKRSEELLGKTISSLTDLLAQLSSSGLSDLLSPSPSNERDFTSTRKLIERNDVFYLGNNTLNDPSLGRVLVTLFLADLAATAGDNYNFMTDNKRKVLVIIDEASDACCEALLALLSKARGAGIGLVLATQSLEDFTSRLGSEAERERLLANIMTKFTMQVRDQKSCEWLSKQTFTSSLITKSRTRAVSTNSQNLLLDGMALGERENVVPDVPLVSPDMFARLPRGEAFITCQGGRIVKIRTSYVKEEEA